MAIGVRWYVGGMTRTWPSAPILVIAVYAMFTGAAGIAGLADAVIVVRGGKPLFDESVPPELLTPKHAVGYVLLGFVCLIGPAYLGAGVGLLRSRGWARLLMRALSLIELAFGFGALCAAMYWRRIGLADPPPLDVGRIVRALLILAVLAQRAAIGPAPLGVSEPSRRGDARTAPGP